MTIQTLLELANPFDAYAKNLGDCLVMFVVAGSSTSNPQFIVRLYSNNDLRTVDQNDLKVYGNPGNSADKFLPEIPNEWKPSRKIPDDDKKYFETEAQKEFRQHGHIG